MPDQLPELSLDLAADSAASRWLVALSGGLDSTVLLHLLQQWCRTHAGSPPLQALHVDHGLHPGAGSWRRQCESQCRRLGVELHCRTVRVERDGHGLEAAARRARYRVFTQLLGEGERLFLGHHLDDQVETVFLRLLRGAGPRGLAAMPARRELGRGQLVRPLLGVPRAHLEAWARARGLNWSEDPSNDDPGLDRNYLRHRVLPLLDERWPGYRETVARAASLAAVAAEQLEVAPPTVYNAFGDPGFELPRSADAETLQLTLRGWLRGRDLPAPPRQALAEWARQLREAPSAAPVRLQAGPLCLQRYRGVLYQLPPAWDRSLAGSWKLAPGASLELPGLGRLSLVPAKRDGFRLAPGEAVTLRGRRGGERCHPLDRGAACRLKQWLQECGVPPWWRQRLPLVYLGDELLAIAHLWPCHSTRRSGEGEPGWALQWTRNTAQDGSPEIELPGPFC